MCVPALAVLCLMSCALQSFVMQKVVAGKKQKKANGKNNEDSEKSIYKRLNYLKLTTCGFSQVGHLFYDALASARAY